MNGIERIARKLCEAAAPCALAGTSPDFLMTNGKPLWSIYVDSVAIVLQAIREPSEAMLIGARDWSRRKLGTPVGNEAATECWQAMLDALVERTEPPSTAERLGLWSVAAVQQRKAERQRLRERMVAQGFVPRITGIEDGIISRAELVSIGWVEDPNRDGWRRP